MKNVLFTLLLFLTQVALNAQENISIPKGEIKGPFVWKSHIYPGTEREYWVYVPRQYDAGKPASLMVVQDGLSRATGWKLPSVLDSLIALKEIPVMIGVFIDHGKVPASGPDNYPRFNRSFEYDARGDRYARFLLEEILPEVEKTYNISKDPNDRSIAGASSGAIAAFNVAWERPDAFRRVLSTIGSYVGLRGAEEFPKLIRVTEPKPIRIFLEDGSNDLDIYAGGWWTANQSMLSALKWAGYEVNHAWGEGEHNSKHAVEILPEALVWLWKDYPAAVKAHPEAVPRRLKSAIEGENWKEIPLQGLKAEKLAVNQKGEVFFSQDKNIYKTEGNKPVRFATLKGKAGGLSFHKDGKLYVADLGQHKIMAIDEKGKAREVLAGVEAEYIALTDKGIYFSDGARKRIGFYPFGQKEVQYFDVPGQPSGLAVSAEQTFLNVGLADGLFGYSFKIQDDGSLAYGQEYVHYHRPYGSTLPVTRGMAVDAENVLYSATALGVQVSDQLGRINFIFAQPANHATDVKLGGADFDTLYLSSDGKLFSRKVNARGVLSWLPPVKPPKPGL